jgi:hypothetical protein
MIITRTCKISVDGWLFYGEFRSNRGEFEMKTCSPLAGKTTWAWLTGPRIIEKPITDLPLAQSVQIRVFTGDRTMKLTGWFRSMEWTFDSDTYEPLSICIRGYVNGSSAIAKEG